MIVEVKMGNHRFRLSDMMPNAWFYKLRDMHKPHHPLTKKAQRPPPPAPVAPPTPNQPLLPNRASYYFPSNSTQLHPSTHFPRAQLLSSTTSRPSVSESDSDVHSYCNITTTPPSKDSSSVDLDVVGSELVLRPILTKPPPAKTKTKSKKQDDNPKLPSTSPAKSKAVHRHRLRSSSSSSPVINSSSSSRKGVRLQQARRGPPPTTSACSRRMRTRGGGGGGIDESFAVVKSSSDPKSDFRESMVEMILENHLTSSKDLEDLLACYLSLNSNHYHHLIVNVFQDIWSDITN